mgnify:CR=1 FL=1
MRLELTTVCLQSRCTPIVLLPQIMVRRERLELSILSALASKTSVYTIPPPTHIHFIIISSLLPTTATWYDLAYLVHDTSLS